MLQLSDKRTLFVYRETCALIYCVFMESQRCLDPDIFLMTGVNYMRRKIYDVLFCDIVNVQVTLLELNNICPCT